MAAIVDDQRKKLQEEFIFLSNLIDCHKQSIGNGCESMAAQEPAINLSKPATLQQTRFSDTLLTQKICRTKPAGASVLDPGQKTLDKCLRPFDNVCRGDTRQTAVNAYRWVAKHKPLGNTSNPATSASCATSVHVSPALTSNFCNSRVSSAHLKQVNAQRLPNENQVWIKQVANEQTASESQIWSKESSGYQLMTQTSGFNSSPMRISKFSRHFNAKSQQYFHQQWVTMQSSFFSAPIVGKRKLGKKIVVRKNVMMLARQHFKAMNQNYTSTYSLKRLNKGSITSPLYDLNWALGRTVSNLSRDKYKFINGTQFSSSSSDGSPRLRQNAQCGRRTRSFSNAHKGAESRLKLDNRPLTDRKIQTRRMFSLAANKYHYSRLLSPLQRHKSTKSTFHRTLSASPIIKSMLSSYRMSSPHKLAASVYKMATAAGSVQNTEAKRYCLFYRRFGRCYRGDECRFIHDPDRVSICTRFLRGTCKIDSCPFSHVVSKDRMPTCSYFLRGLCSRGADCPYLHVNVTADAAVCQDFVDGCCKLAENCKQKHVILPCPDFMRTGACRRGQLCSMSHPRRRGSKDGRRNVVTCPDIRTTKSTPAICRCEEVQDGTVGLDWRKHKRLPSYISLVDSIDDTSVLGHSSDDTTVVLSDSQGGIPVDISVKCITVAQDTRVNSTKLQSNTTEKSLPLICSDFIHPQLRPISISLQSQLQPIIDDIFK